MSSKKQSSWLNKEEWEKLDELLSKHGFGGYYDLVECLKRVLSKIQPGKDHSHVCSLPSVVKALMGATQEGF